MSLILGEQLKNNLISYFQTAHKVFILSAYFSEPAAKLLIKNLPLESTAKVVVRARPHDLVSGATDIRAIRLLFDNGISCYIHRSLHAKLYIIDNDIGFVGSANFTANGLKISGYGNIELSTKISVSEEDLSLANQVMFDSILVTNDVLSKLEDFVDALKDEGDYEQDDWWENILQLRMYDVSEGLFIADLPWTRYGCDADNEASQHDQDVFGFNHVKSNKSRTQKFLNSKVYQFIKQKLEQSDDGMAYFGEVTSWIHMALKDDILPYRAEIKEYVANVYSYFDSLAKSEFVIDKPNYSQRISLKNSHKNYTK